MLSKITPSDKLAYQPHDLLHPSVKTFDLLPDSALISLPVVCTMFGCSPATIWRRVRQGDLVAPYRIGKRTTRWIVGDIRQALANKGVAK